MRSIAKPILIIAGVISALIALAVLCLNIFIQSQSVQAKLKQAVFKTLGAEPVIAKTYYTPWSGLTLSGIKIPQAGNAKKPMLAVESIKCRIDLPSLLQGQILINKILIEEPGLLVVQGQSPVWPASAALPFQAIDTTSVSRTEPSIEKNSTPQSTPAPSSTPATLPQPATEKKVSKTSTRISPAFSGVFRIHRGHVMFYPSTTNRPVRLEGFAADGNFLSNGAMAGTFRAKSVVISDLIRYSDITGHFEYRDGNLKITEIDGNWAGGKIHGMLELTFGNDARFSSSITADNVSLQKLSEEAGFSAEGMQGTLLANATLRGIPGHPESFSGVASASLAEARMQPIDPIRQLGEMLRINELQMLELRTARTALTVREGKIVVDRIEMESANLLLDASGEAQFDGKLDLDARLHVTDALLKNSFGLIGSKFQPSEREGYAQMPFSISGNIARPKSDLLDKLVGIRLGDDVGGLLKNLFRVPKKEKKKKNEPAPAATPN